MRKALVLALGWAASTAVVAGAAIHFGQDRYEHAVEKRAKAALSHIRGAAQVRVHAVKRDVTISGIVADASAHLQAVGAVRATPGVDGVVDRLVVETSAPRPTDDSLVVTTLPVPPLISTLIPAKAVGAGTTGVGTTGAGTGGTGGAAETAESAGTARPKPALTVAEAQARVDDLLSSRLTFTAKGPSVVTGLTLEQIATTIAAVDTGEVEVDVQPSAGASADQIIHALLDRGASTPRWTPVLLKPDAAFPLVRIVLKPVLKPVQVDSAVPAVNPTVDPPVPPSAAP